MAKTIPREGFAMVPNKLIWSREVSGSAKLVFQVLRSYNPSEPSIQHIRELTGLAKKTVLKAIQELEARQIISVRRRNGSSLRKPVNQYTVLDSSLWNLERFPSEPCRFPTEPSDGFPGNCNKTNNKTNNNTKSEFDSYLEEDREPASTLLSSEEIPQSVVSNKTNLHSLNLINNSELGPSREIPASALLSIPETPPSRVSNKRTAEEVKRRLSPVLQDSDAPTCLKQLEAYVIENWDPSNEDKSPHDIWLENFRAFVPGATGASVPWSLRKQWRHWSSKLPADCSSVGDKPNSYASQIS